jgi:hypothetical protein
MRLISAVGDIALNLIQTEIRQGRMWRDTSRGRPYFHVDRREAFHQGLFLSAYAATGFIVDDVAAEASECALMLPRKEAPFICLFPDRQAWVTYAMRP